MSKKKKCILLVIILVICVFIFTLLLNKNNSNLIVNEIENCDNEAKLYYEIDGKKIYSYCLDIVEIVVDDKNIDLKEYLKNNSIDDLVDMLEKESTFYDGGTSIYKDGGTKKITSNGITLIRCNTLDGNRDIYIGNKDMEYKVNFCKNDNRTFTRTYMIKKIEDYKEQNCNDCLTCVCGKSLSVTLNQFQSETKTVIIDSYWDELFENKTYEFEFMLNEGITDIEDNIEFIFKNSTIVEIRETNKVGLLQRQDEIK